MRIIFVRHAEPDYSIDSLTEKGFKEAELLSKRLTKLPVKKFYCSPLGRAQNTAKPTISKLGCELETVDWLREFTGYIIDPDTGKFRVPWDLMPDYWTKYPELFDCEKWIDNPVMDSGDVRWKYKDICNSIDGLIEEYGYKRNGRIYEVINGNTDTIVLFCHFGIECVMLSHILNISPIVLWQGFVALPSSVTTLITEEREEGKVYFRCNAFGDISHLYAEGEEPSFAARFCEIYSNDKERH